MGPGESLGAACRLIELILIGYLEIIENLFVWLLLPAITFVLPGSLQPHEYNIKDIWELHNHWYMWILENSLKIMKKWSTYECLGIACNGKVLYVKMKN